MPFIGRGGIFTFLLVAVRTPGKIRPNFKQYDLRGTMQQSVLPPIYTGVFLRAVLKNGFFKPISRVFYRDVLKKGDFPPRLNEKGA